MSVPCAPHEYCLHADQWKPVCLVPKTEKADNTDANGGESQLHLEAAVHGPADACGGLIGIEDVTEQAAHDAKPARETDHIEGNDLDDRLFPLHVACVEQMHTDRNARHQKLKIKVESRNLN